MGDFAVGERPGADVELAGTVQVRRNAPATAQRSGDVEDGPARYSPGPSWAR